MLSRGGGHIIPLFHWDWLWKGKKGEGKQAERFSHVNLIQRTSTTKFIHLGHVVDWPNVVVGDRVGSSLNKTYL